MTSSEGLRLDAYLGRVGYSGPFDPDAEVLDALHAAHLAHIPFENLDILLGRPIRLDLPSLQAKLVDRRRGGYCFEQNTLFRAVLEAAGFHVNALAARVRVGSDQMRARTHMLLRVTPLDSNVTWIADVGFGGDGFLHPLPLEPGAVTDDGTAAHRLQCEGDSWVLQTRDAGAWTDLYAFTLEPHFPVDFEVANHYTSTHPSSPFVRGLTAQRLRPDVRAVLRDRALSLRRGSTTAQSTIGGPADLLEALHEYFGLAFPSDTRFSKPAFAGDTT